MSGASAVRRVPAWAKGVLGLVTLLALAAVVLEQGVWTRHQDLAGPFEREGSPGSRALFFHVDDRVPLACCLEVRSDNPDRPYQSDLRLSINGQAMGPPHTVHIDIRRGDTAGFSHWSGYVFFAPPNGAESVHAFVEYSVRPTRPTLWLLVVAAGSLWLALYGRAAADFAAGRGRALSTAAIVAPYWILIGLGGLGLAGVAAFLGVTVYAWAAGWALPTTAVIRWSATARWLAAGEPQLGQLLVGVAAIGALGGWMALLVPGGQEAVEREDARLLRYARWAGAPIAAGCLIFSLSAMWSGLVRPGDQQGSAIGGLISFSDASNYIGEAYDQARDGFWRSITLRRPLAGAFRSLLLLVAGYSVPWMLVAQAIVLAAALCVACLTIARWRGSWAALAFFGLSYTYIRSFAPTTLTEPLGLAWGFVSIACFVVALQSRSRAHAVFGVGAMTLSLMTRMGSMFAVPALLAWLLLRRGDPRRLKTAALALGSVAGVVGLSLVLSALYSGGQNVTGSNFSYTACGLAIGTDWTGCPQKFVEAGHPLPDDVHVRDALLYRMALENIETHPRVILHRLGLAADAFLSELPDVAWRGYEGSALEPSWWPSTGLSWLALIGIAAVWRRRREPGEISFWLWVTGAILVSAPFVYFDDGQRVLATSYTLLYLLFAIGFSCPTRSTAPGLVTTPVRRLRVVAATAMLGLVFAPLVSHTIYQRTAPRVDPPQGPAGYWIWGRRISGFLVVADAAPLPSAVPAVHVSDFAKMIAPVEGYQGLIHPESPPLPFAFVYAPRLPDRAQSEFDFVAPPALLERHDVLVWHLAVEDWQRPAGHAPYWFRVTDAAVVR